MSNEQTAVRSEDSLLFRWIDVLRWLLTVGVLVMVYGETGPWTTVAFGMIALGFEQVIFGVRYTGRVLERFNRRLQR